MYKKTKEVNVYYTEKKQTDSTEKDIYLFVIYLLKT